MRKTPLRKIGEIGEANIEARKQIALIAEEKGLNHCELGFTGCTKTWPLAPAHRHKRAWYKGNVDLLADPNEWITACQNCHNIIEHNPDLTEDVFAKLRPKKELVV